MSLLKQQLQLTIWPRPSPRKCKKYRNAVFFHPYALAAGARTLIVGRGRAKLALFAGLIAIVQIAKN